MPLTVDVAPGSAELGSRAAAFVAEKIKSTVAELDGSRNARVIFATGAS